MRIPEALKRLKKNLKRRRGWTLAAVAALTGAALAASVMPPQQPGASPEKYVPVMAAGHPPVTVILHKRFICGEDTETLGIFELPELEALSREHPEWRLVKNDGGEAVFSAEVDDLSPACKEVAHFGLDGQGRLTLYEGSPQEGRAVRSYFRVDMDALRENLPEEAAAQLMEGIRVSDYAEYSSVLSSYSDFAAP